MKRKLKSDRGFTLAELLIVVAIIGVLVAIAIPIFTSQLERSREAVDLSDVRSAYAEVMMAAITGDTSATYTKDNGQTIYGNGEYSITVTPLKQQKDDWQTPLPITIGGVSSSASEPYWVGAPGAGGSCKITYHPPTSTGDEYVSFYWTGGTDNGNNPNLTPVPTQPIFPIETPTPTTAPDEPITDIDAVINKWGSCEWPDNPSPETKRIDANYRQIISYGSEYYIVANPAGYRNQVIGGNYYWTPDDPSLNGQIVHITKKVHNWTELNNTEVIYGLSGGDIFITKDNKAYVFKSSGPVTIPSGGENYDKERWVRVDNTQTSIWY